ncbi:MAG: anti-sigma factor antagonist [Lentisphaeria bacterium]|nr:anti-sigma factor antagonist [Lentisphaeria bacterium]
MILETQKVGRVVIANFLTEDLDASNVSSFRSEISDVIKYEQSLVLNLSQLSFMDSSGLGAILSTLRRIESRGGKMVVCNMGSTVKSLFELVRMQKVIETFDSESSALAAFFDKE